MKKNLILLSLLILLSEASAQFSELRNKIFNQCMESRIITRDNEKYQVAYCKDVTNSEINEMKTTSIRMELRLDELIKTKSNLPSGQELLNDKKSEVVVNFIENYNYLNSWSNEYTKSSYFDKIKVIYPYVASFEIDLKKIIIQKTDEYAATVKRCDSDSKEQELLEKKNKEQGLAYYPKVSAECINLTIHNKSFEPWYIANPARIKVNAPVGESKNK